MVEERKRRSVLDDMDDLEERRAAGLDKKVDKKKEKAPDEDLDLGWIG